LKEAAVEAAEAAEVLDQLALLAHKDLLVQLDLLDHQAAEAAELDLLVLLDLAAMLDQ
jgi:hypothetical protein